MVSEAAVEDIERLAGEGVHLSPREVVRLNALGLRMERPARPEEALFYLPRVAVLGDVHLHEPTLGHEAWLDQVAELVNMDEGDTLFAVKLFAISHASADELPSPYDAEAVANGVAAISARLKDCTERQVVAAMLYAESGLCADDGESAPLRDDGDEDEPRPERFSVATGVILNGVAITGLSVAEARGLTRAQMSAMRLRALKASHSVTDEDERNDAAGAYHAAMDEIVERHKGAKHG